MKHDFIRFLPKLNFVTVPKLCLRIFEEFIGLKPGYVRLIKGYCERILCLLPAEYRISLTNVERDEYMRHVYKDVKSYIEEHCDSVTTSELSRTFGYNRDYFNRLIKRFSEKGYTELLQAARIKAAVSLLETTKYSIEDIAVMVGYSNQGFFYRTFYASYGCTPGEYRKNVVHYNE